MTNDNQPKGRELPKRFYKEVSVAAEQADDAGAARWLLFLDGRPVRTPAKNPVAVPTEALAEKLAEEWRRQEAVIDPDTMPATRILNSVLDGVVGREAEVAADLAAYVGSDLVC